MSAAPPGSELEARNRRTRNVLLLVLFGLFFFSILYVSFFKH